jgi:outer membrane protein TolC
MRRHRVIVLGVMLSAVVAPRDASAQRALSLADAQAEARVHAPDAGELQARIAAAEAMAAQAARRFRDDPTISGGFSQGRVVGRSDESSWSLGVQQPFDLSGSWKPRAASAAADVERSRQERENGLRALDEQVAIAFADSALAQRQLARDERLADLYRMASDAVHQQFQVGAAPQIDDDSAELDLAGALASVEMVRGDLNRNRARLARLLGRESGGDLAVDDGSEVPDLAPTPPEFAVLVDRDSRVRAALAEVDAATFQRQIFERLIRPPLTVGVEYGRQTRDIPVGSFVGAPFASSLAANWTDAEIVFNVGVALPLFNRQREPRAQATGRVLTADAKLRTARADVRAELESSWAALQAAASALKRVAPTGAIIDRDVTFVEQAVGAGAFDTLTRTQELRRLQEAGRRVDTAVRDFRAARAAWIRRISVLP